MGLSCRTETLCVFVNIYIQLCVYDVYRVYEYTTSVCLHEELSA